MHILVITSWYKSRINPYGGIFFEDHARMLQRFGHKVAIFCVYHELRFLGESRFSSPYSEGTFLDEGLITAYITTQSFWPRSHEPTFLDTYLFSFKCRRKFKEYCKKHGKPDIIHAHSSIWAGLLAYDIWKNYRIPYIISEHFSGWILKEQLKKSLIYPTLLYRVLKNSSSSFVVSNFFKQKLEDYYNLDSTLLKVMPNMVNQIFFDTPIKDLKDNQFIFLVVGNLVPLKNHSLIINAIRQLNDPNVILRIAGSGKEENNLKLLAQELGILDKLEFLGNLSRKELADALNQIHVVISASQFETFGLSLVEGMAMGRPVISADSGGPRDFVNDFNGVILTNTSVACITQAMRNMMLNYSQYNPLVIRDFAFDNFSEESLYRRLVTTYKDIILKC